MRQSKIIKQRNYLYELIFIPVIGLLFLVWWLVLGSASNALLAGAISYLVLAWSLRLIFQKHHRKGMFCLRTKDYSGALTAFNQSFDFFEKHPLIDKYRYITMFSSSAIPYRNMALNNIGVCYFNTGKYDKALTAFKKLAELDGNSPNTAEAIKRIEQHISKNK